MGVKAGGLLGLVLAIAASAPAGSQQGPAAMAPAPSGAASCSGCHAPASLATAVPVLDGYSAADIVAAMEEYRAGRRPATVMDRIAKGFTPTEIEAIAAWLAAPRKGTQ